MKVTDKKQIDVSIGLIFHHNTVLVGWRNAQQHQGNHDEFPGGKVEVNETPMQACRREVAEEVGLYINDWHWVDTLDYDYSDRYLRLHFFSAAVDASQLNKIKSGWSWHSRADILQLNFPAANAPILQRLYWPPMIQVCTEFPTLALSVPESPKRPSTQPLTRLYYWRLDLEQCAQDFQASAHYPSLLQATPQHLQQLIVNIDIYAQLPPTLQNQIGAVHYKQHQLMALDALRLEHPAETLDTLLPACRRIAACHDLASLVLAQDLAMDALFLSPVQATHSHPGEKYLGWERFAEYAAQSHIPVFALGGIGPADLTQVRDLGGYGVAGIRQF